MPVCFSWWSLVLGRKLNVKCDSLPEGTTFLCEPGAAARQADRGRASPSTAARPGAGDALLFFLFGFVHGGKFSWRLIVNR